MIWDARRHCQRKAGLIALPVHLPEDQRQLFLGVSRPGSGRKPWYLITSEPVENAVQAWQIPFAYARRWQVEMSLRFTQTEMAFESPRLRAWEARLKFLLIASLANAFLLSLLANMDFLFSFIFATVTEPESGAEIISQLHFIVYVSTFPAFGSTFALTPCLP